MKYVSTFLSRSIPSLLSQNKSLSLHNIQSTPSPLTCIRNRFQSIRSFASTTIRSQENEASEKEEINPILLRHPERDRSKVIPVETSIKYMKSAAFKEAYGDKPVWFYYRRNHKHSKPPPKTRKLCVRANIVATGNPCPICRDEYLIVDYTNTDLLQQFISPITGNILSYNQTGVCQKQHKNLLVAFEKAKDLGLITFDVPHRSYDYDQYKP